MKYFKPGHNPGTVVCFFMPRYFAVFQGTTYEEEKALSCLWAPKFGQNGQEFHHHKRLIEVNTGDRVIHLVKKRIVAISTVKAKAYDAEAPWLKDEKKPWLKDGRKVDVEIIELDDPINTDSIFDRVKNFLPEKYSPFNKDGGGNQGYFYEVGHQVFNIILNTDFEGEKLSLDFVDQNLNTPTGSSINSKLKVNVRSSTWQKYFKNQLFKYWGIKCVLTNVKNKDLLIGAHIKPWTKSDDKEKIDVFNGLPLSPNADKIFELGLISFNEQGKLIKSSQLSNDDLSKLNINLDVKLDFKDEHFKYLNYHRLNKFKK